MKPLSIAKLRQMAATRDLDVGDEELTRLLPMVRDLLDVARGLRSSLRAGASKQSG